MLKLYTDESPGLKVDPFVVMVLSIGFIISVVALHSEYTHAIQLDGFDREPRFQISDLDILQRNLR
jgi:preprotein translocase subunit Sec61beta